MRIKVKKLKEQQKNLLGKGEYKNRLKRLQEEQKGLKSGLFINQPKILLKREKLKKLQIEEKYLKDNSKKNDLNKKINIMLYG